MRHLLLMVFSLTSLLVHGQDSIILNFRTKAIQLPDPIRKTKMIWLKITNLPTDQYKISINKTDSMLSAGTPPALFGVLSFGEGFSSIIAQLGDYTVNHVTPVIPGLTDDTMKLTSNPSKFLGPPSQFVVTSCSDSNPVLDIREEIEGMRLKIFEFHYTFRDEVINKADQLIYQVTTGAMKDFQAFQQSAEAILQKRLDRDQELEEQYVNYYNCVLIPKNYTLLKSCPALNAGDSMLTTYKKNFNLFLEKFDSSFNRITIARIYNQLKMPATRDYVSLPYPLSGNLTKFDIEINPVNPEKTFQSYSTSFTLEKRPHQILSFTSGIFLSGLRNHEFATSIELGPNSENPNKMDTLNYTILQEKNTRVSAGINALLHFGSYFKGVEDLGYFVAFGPGLSFEKKPQLRILLGAGLMFGRQNKLTLTAGLVGGTVNRLSSSYSLDNPYYALPGDISYAPFKTSWFLSLGYSLFNQ